MRSIALASALMLSLAGCSGDDSSTTDDSATTNTTQTSNSTTNTTSTSSSSSTTDGTGSGTDSDGMTTTTDGTTDGTTTTAGTTDGTTTASETTSTTGTTGGTDTDATTGTTGGGNGDGEWPMPDANNPNMPCPDGFVAASFVMGGLVCAPECMGVMNSCPSGESGDSMGACVFNPESSGMACMEGDMCDDAMENCVQTGGGGFACLKPSSHCALLCGGGKTCPEGMECMGDLVCQYPA